MTVPPFHGAGLGQYLLNAIPFGNVIIAPATAAIATAQGVVDALKQAPADIAVLVPSVVAELAQNPELLEYLLCQSPPDDTIHWRRPAANYWGPSRSQGTPSMSMGSVRGRHPASVDTTRAGADGLALRPFPPMRRSRVR